MTNDTQCAVDGCEKHVKNRGWCSAHYARWLRNGTPGPAGDARRRPAQQCSIDGCEARSRARGWCYKHHARWLRHGHTDLVHNYGAKRSETGGGYIRVWRPGHPLAHADGYVLEHRLVAWEAGTLTAADPGIHVHHKNENRADNDPANLEPKPASDHHRDHVRAAGFVVNQYGTWPLRYT